MIIDLSRIHNSKEITIPFEFNVPFESETLINSYNIIRTSEIHVAGNLSTINKELIIHVNYDGVIVLKCDRCLESYDFKLSGDVLKRIIPENQYEMGSPEDDIYYYEDANLDISKFVMDDIFLNLPIQMVCKSDCKGLCTTCGADLNETDCDCDKENIDPRFEVLNGFFDKEEV